MLVIRYQRQIFDYEYHLVYMHHSRIYRTYYSPNAFITHVCSVVKIVRCQYRLSNISQSPIIEERYFIFCTVDVLEYAVSIIIIHTYPVFFLMFV